MEISEKTYTNARTVSEAMQVALNSGGNFRFIAGGTDVMVNAFQGNDNTVHLIDINRLEELKGIVQDEHYLRIGALTRLDQLKHVDAVKREFPILIEAAQAVGSPLIRRSATLGGNVLCENRCIYFNQSEWWRMAVGYCLKCSGDVCIATGGKKACFSEFASDTAPALISLKAQLLLHEPGGERLVPLESIYSGDGIKPLLLPRTSLVKEILLPRAQHFKSAFKKLRLRESLEFTSLTVAVSKDMQGAARLVLGGVDPKPVLLELQPGESREDIIKTALKKGRAVDNDMFSRAYRRDMIRVYIHQCLNQIDFQS
ncbi:MAG TPA: FAD binding domain-containing protein [Bacteroidia bacterium]|nr:FAD binding domain-containing protein [Bacteroidia bacterium]